MKKYKVAFYYTVYGSVDVKAKNEEEARDIIQEKLSYSIDDLGDYEQNDREYNAEEAEEITYD